MADDTFICDRCGRTWPRNQLKEVVMGDGGREMKVDPECLDEIMQNEATAVTAVPGQEKQVATRVEPGEGPAERVDVRDADTDLAERRASRSEG